MQRPIIGAIPFPPDVPPAESFWWLHGMLFVLAVGAFAGVLLRSSLPARRVDLLIWLCIIPTGGLLFELSPAGKLVDLTFRAGVTTFIAVTALMGFVVTALRLYQRQQGSRIGFAVVCLLIFNTLSFLMLPATPTARAASRRTQCKNNLHQLGLALHKFAEKQDSLPAPISNEDESPRSWRVELLPWIDEQPLREQYRDDAAWDSEANAPVARTVVPMLQCPADPTKHDDVLRAYTAYAALSGPESVFSESGRRGFPKSVIDDASHTLMLVEACGQRIVWTEPRDCDTSQLPIGINLDGDAPGRSAGVASSFHPDGFHATLADGSVRFFNQTIDPAVLKAMTTYNGGEQVPEF